ncbi:MAG: dihydrofolate reductase [Treponemataceae bacterium]|nr:dihydrofolate reductase [Treponemataceae bacterium]
MISLIAAFSENKVIGCSGKIPWNLPEDQKNFKELTSGNIVIMGRKTFAEIYEKFGHPLKNRFTLLLSSTMKIEEENCHTVNNLKEALSFANTNFPDKEIFICGGEEVFRQALPLVEKMYISHIPLTSEGDAFFPDFDTKLFEIISEKEVQDKIPFTYRIYKRK